MSPAELARSILEREMSPAEFDEQVRRIVADAEDLESVRELIAWFTRRYRTPEERLAYVRRKVKALRAQNGDSVIARLRSVPPSNDLTSDEVVKLTRG